MSSRKTRYWTPRVCRRSRCQLGTNTLPYLIGSPGRQGSKVTPTSRGWKSLFLFLRACAAQNACHRVVGFVARVLVDGTVARHHRKRHGPWPREHARVVHRELIVERLRVDSPEPLDETHLSVR